MSGKKFKTLDEQIEILKNKGLTINDYEKTKEILYRENYFFINGYRYLFMRSSQDKRFYLGTAFEELYATFVFDRHLRNIMFKNILIIENNIKSKISYTLSKKYGFKEKDYLDLKNFTSNDYKIKHVKDVINKMKRQMRKNGQKHNATLHYINNYGYIPLWVLVKVLSLGIVSELYCILKTDDKMEIANDYNIDVEDLIVYLSILANFRNLCAHEDILYEHRIQRVIPDTKYHRLLNIEITNGLYNFGKNDLYALVIIMKYMLTADEFRELIYEIDYEINILDGKIVTVPLSIILNKIGFPDNWKDIINIE